MNAETSRCGFKN